MLTMVVNGPSGEVPVGEYLDLLGVAVRALEDVSRSVTTATRRPAWHVARLHTSEPTMVLTADLPVGAPEGQDILVVDHYLRSLATMEGGTGTPKHFTYGTLQRLHTVTSTFGQGKVRGFTASRASDDGDPHAVFVTRESFRNLDRILKTTTESIGSITGILRTVTVNKGRHLQVSDDVFGAGVRCDVDADLLHEAGAWIEDRVRVTGIITRDVHGRPQKVQARGIEPLPQPESYLSVSEMAGAIPDFTDGLSAEDFIRSHRA